MENRTQFDLNESISNWKNSLAKSGVMTDDNILELESHFLDEMDKLKMQELSEEECFLIAKSRMGNLGSLTSEYEKVNVKKSFLLKAQPYLKGILIYLLFISFSDIFYFSTILAAKWLDFGIAYKAIMISVIGAIVIAIVSIFNSTKVVSVIKRLNKISTLLILTIISKPLHFFIIIFLIQKIEVKTVGLITTSFQYFHISIFILILISSFIVSMNIRKSNKLILQK